MGEAATGDVADGPDAVDPLHPQAVVHIQISARLQAHGVHAYVRGVRPAPHGHQDLVTRYFAPSVEGDGHRPVGALPADAHDLRSGEDPDPLRFEPGLDLLARERFLPCQQARSALDHGDLIGAEALAALGHLGADGAAAQHDQATGELLHRGDVPVVPGVDVGQAGDRGHHRRRPARHAHRDVRFHPNHPRLVRRLDLHGLPAGQSSVPPVEGDPLALEPFQIAPVGPVVRHVIALVERGLHVQRPRDGLGGPRDPSSGGQDVAGPDQRLAGDASEVGTLPTGQTLFHDGRGEPSIDRAAGGVLPRGPCPDHHHVEPIGHGAPSADRSRYRSRPRRTS